MPNLPEFHAARDWTNPADFPTHQNNEAQNRADLQEWFTSWENWFNNTFLPTLAVALTNTGSGSGTGAGGGVSGDYLPLDGGTMRGILRLFRNPQLDAEAATKQYIDNVAGRVAADAAGNFTAISQRADEIELLAQNNEGDIASLRLRADTIESRVDDVDGNGSSIEQTAQSIIQRVTNAEGDISDITQTVNGISMGVSTVTENGNVFSRITLTIGENNLYGYIRMDGNVNVSGQLSAEALYSGYGEVANLAVDQLITSRRIVKYLAGDTSDDNYIRAYAQNLEWVTATSTGGTAQAVNPDGAPLYWPVRIAGLSRGADGYPVNRQGERIFTTTTPTDYPVMVYNYTEAVKRSISFEPVNGIYSPVDRYGAGNQQGNNKAWIVKSADGFDIRYLTPDNKEIGIRMGTDGKVRIDGLAYDIDAIRAAFGMATSDGTGGDGAGGDSGSGAGASGGTGGTSGVGTGFDLTQINADGTTSGLTVDADGYTDVSGLRKPVAIDFSGLSGGQFSETLDGGVYNTYSVERDGSGRISKITDGSGHETVITW